MKRRRGHGEGSIFHRKDGSWVAQVDRGWENGHRKRHQLYARTFAQAREKLAAARKAARDNLPVPDERRTTGSFLREWLDGKRGTVRASTWQSYEVNIRRHVMPVIGHVPLVKLAPAHVQTLYAGAIKSGLSPTSTRHIAAMLHTALGQAEAWGLVTRNVARLVKAPRAPRPEMKTFSPEQARQLLDTARGDRLEALYAVALTTGMREGELFGLMWPAVDLEGATLQVRTSLQRAEHGRAVGDPKTARSRRLVKLTQTAVGALRRHRAAQQMEARVAGDAWEGEDFVFTNEVGRPLDPSNFLRRCFYPLLERAGLPRLRFHGLRHTAATLLLGRAIHPKVVSEMLGHSQIAITLDLYSHVTPTMQSEAAAAFDAVLGART